MAGKITKKERMQEIAFDLKMMWMAVQTLPADESTVEVFTEEIDGEMVSFTARPLRKDIAEKLRDIESELWAWY